MTTMPDPEDNGDEVDVEERIRALDDDVPDEEAVVDAGEPPRRDDVDEADYLEQTEEVPDDDEDYPYEG